MKKRLLLPLVLILALVLSLTACFGKKIQSIEIKGGAPTEVLVGETPDFSGIKLLVTYNDLSTEEIGFGDVTISEIDTSKPGKVEYTVTYGELTITSSLEVKVPNAPSTDDKKPVAPTLVSLAYRSGLKTSIYKNDEFDTSALTLTATYSDGSTKIVTAKDLKLSEIDPKTVGEQTLTATYESMTVEFKITVVDVVPVAIEIDADSVDTTVAEGQDPDISTLKVYLVYNNGFKHVIENDPLLVVDNFPVYPDLNWVITYGNLSTTVKLSNTPPVVESIKVNNGYNTWVLLGETYTAGDLSASATLSNNLKRTVTGLTISDVDTTTAGKKTVTATYTNDDGTFTDTFEIEVVTVVSVAIDTGSFNATTTIGKFDVSTLRVDLTLSNGEYIERTEGITINYSAGFDANEVCQGTITATFQGVTSAPVNVTILDEEFQYLVSGVADPDQIANWKQNTYQNNFLDSGYAYAVGSANPFKYVLTVSLLDPTTYRPVEGYYGYVGASEVLLDGAPVGAEYVTIDETNHTFQFTKAAEGKTFTIKTCPDNIPASKVETFTKALTVTVVDAYNVHDAKELNVITNVTKDLGNSGYDMLTVVNNFLLNNNITRPETINGVVLHNNFTISKSDLPSEFFFEGSDGNTYIWDHQSIYYHELQAKGSFNIYGNYFTVNTYNIPIVAPVGTTTKGGAASNDDDGYSSSEIFRFNVAESIYKNDPDFNHTDYEFNIYALSLNDNDESVSVEELVASKRHMLGAYAFKIAKATYNFNAVNATRYYITLMQEYDCVTSNLNYVKFYDAWQSHINTWTGNNIAYLNDTDEIHANHTHCLININNSFVGKAGGPAIMAMSEDPDEPCNSMSKTEVIVTDSEVFSYVVGDEAWFTSHYISEQAIQIAQLNGFFQLNGASFGTQIGENSNAFMNMIMINMDADYIPGVSQGTPKDIDGSLTINTTDGQGNIVTSTSALNMDDGIRQVYVPQYGAVIDMPCQYGNGYVDLVVSQIPEGTPVPPPIFASNNGGVGYTDLQTFTPVTGADVYQGDYLALYWYNIGIGLGFNEGALSAEPTPPAAPLNTAARTYN